jgi:hypothetical protein
MTQRLPYYELTNVGRKFSIEWQDCIKQRDYGYLLKRLLSPSMHFYSPVVHKVYTDRPTIDRILGFVLVVFEDLTYVGETLSVNEYNQEAHVVLRFTAKITLPDGKQLDFEGVDIFRVNSDGQAVELRVALRPLNATIAVAEAMKQKMLYDTTNSTNAFALQLAKL